MSSILRRTDVICSILIHFENQFGEDYKYCNYIITITLSFQIIMTRDQSMHYQYVVLWSMYYVLGHVSLYYTCCSTCGVPDLHKVWLKSQRRAVPWGSSPCGLRGSPRWCLNPNVNCKRLDGERPQSTSGGVWHESCMYEYSWELSRAPCSCMQKNHYTRASIQVD